MSGIYIADWNDGTLHVSGVIVFLIFGLPVLAWLAAVIVSWFS